MFCPKGAQDCNRLHWMTGFVTDFEPVQVEGGRKGGGNVGRMVGKGAGNGILTLAPATGISQGIGRGFDPPNLGMESRQMKRTPRGGELR